MAHPPEASPPKENSITWPGRLEGAFEVNTSSAGLGRALLTQHQMPNVLHMHHLLPLLTWAIGDLWDLCPQPGTSGWHPTPATHHLTCEGSCMFKTLLLGLQPYKPTTSHPTWSFITRHVGPSCIPAQLMPPLQIIFIWTFFRRNPPNKSLVIHNLLKQSPVLQNRYCLGCHLTRLITFQGHWEHFPHPCLLWALLTLARYGLEVPPGTPALNTGCWERVSVPR